MHYSAKSASKSPLARIKMSATIQSEEFPMRVLLTGEVETMGSALKRVLTEQGAQVIVATGCGPRRHATTVWDSESKLISGLLNQVDVVYHLAGTSESSTRSSVNDMEHLVRAMSMATTKPRRLVCTSSVNWYGDRGTEQLTERSSMGKGLGPDLFEILENTANSARSFGTQVSIVRLGDHLAPDHGIFPRMVPVFQAGLAGKLGTGEQWMSWIHSEDAVEILRLAGQNEQPFDVLNAVAPQSLTNSIFTHNLANLMQRPTDVSKPSMVLRIALRDLSTGLHFSKRVAPQELMKTGYSFRFPTITSALDHLLKHTPSYDHQAA
jgi:uncharacterized protein